MKSIPILLILFFMGIVLDAQESTPIRITEDDVASVAKHMYCPVCENEPLDICYTTTCIQWKTEIRRRLEAGESRDEIIAFFVMTYGEHVAAVPQNPILKLLSYFAPILGVVIALAIAFMTFQRWQKDAPKAQVTSASPSTDDNAYRSQIERDVR
jgi:cytochrome c-type biogenesis protein CcmH